MSATPSPGISITIPVFNGMPFIESAIHSALEQIGPQDELIVVDNASTDGTRDFLLALKHPQVRIVVRSTTQSVHDNWTQAIQETRGDFVKLMCADDLIEPGCLHEQRQILEKDPSLRMVAGRRVIIDDTGKVLIARHGLNGFPAKLSGEAAIRKCLVAGTNLLGEPAAVMFRGEDIRNAMPWDSRWPYMLDLATYAKVIVDGQVAAIPEPVARFRVSASSWSAQILHQQPRDFRGWRAWQQLQPMTGLNMWERMRSDFSLRIRTAARSLYFRRVAKRSSVSP